MSASVVSEAERLETLRSHGLLDTPPEEAFDRIVRIAATICSCPIALISLIDADRQWFKAATGLDVKQTAREDSFCAHAVEKGQTLVVEDAWKDERFAQNPLVLSSPCIRFYAGVPIRSRNGMALGSLCVIDRSARHLSSPQYDALHALALEVEAQIELRRAVHELREAEGERQQLTALIVHDLRGPITVVLGGMHYLQSRVDVPGEVSRTVDDVMVAGHALERMMMNLLDIGAGESGRLRPIVSRVSLASLFDHIATTARYVAFGTQHVFEAVFELEAQEIVTDVDLVRRTLENLLDNAFKYAPPGSTVRLHVQVPVGGPLLARVSDAGPGVPLALRTKIFDMHVRLDPESGSHRGHGFGLTSCRLAVAALGGRIWMEPNVPAGAVFCIELPVAAAG